VDQHNLTGEPTLSGIAALGVLVNEDSLDSLAREGINVLEEERTINPNHGCSKENKARPNTRQLRQRLLTNAILTYTCNLPEEHVTISK
jgi:hypothetical protein